MKARASVVSIYTLMQLNVLTALIKPPDYASKKMDNLVMNIINSCFSEKAKDIVLIGNFSNPDHFISLKNSNVAFITLDLVNTHNEDIDMYKPSCHFVKENKTECMQKSSETHIVISLISSTTNLIGSIKRLKHSKWWNHEALFLFVNKNSYDHCNVAKKYLNLVWSYNILSALLLCQSADNILHMYTFNPYSTNAPKFWNITEISSIQNHEWTLFQHTFSSIHNIQFCQHLNFMKTANLNGYRIKIGLAYYLPKMNNPNMSLSLDMIRVEAGDIGRVLWNYVNASSEIIYYDSLKLTSDNASSLFFDLKLGNIDYGLNELFQRSFWKQQTYPHTISGLCVVARMEKVSSLKKLYNLFRLTTWFIIVGLFLLSAYLLKFILQRNFSKSVLEVIRMMVGMSSQKEPKGCSRRQFFVIFIFVTMGLNAYFQSRTNAIYIIPDEDSVIDTVKDLYASGLPIYGFSNFKTLLDNEMLGDRYHEEDNLFDCLTRVAERKNHVCLYACNLYNITNLHGAHVAKNKMRDIPLTLVARDDWPLMSRVNEILRRMSQAGLIDLFQKRQRSIYYKFREITDDWNSISFDKAKVAFCILLWGQLLSVCVFIVELVVFKFNKSK